MESNPPGFAVGLILAFVGAYLVLVAVLTWANVRIIRRSGYSGWWVLIGLVPIANLVMYLVFAFKECPAERELKQLRAWAAQMHGYGGGQYPPNYGGQYPGWR